MSVMFLVIVGFVVIILLEVPRMVAKDQVKEMLAFWMLLAIGFVLSLSVVQRWPLANPTPAVEALFGPLAGMLGLE